MKPPVLIPLSGISEDQFQTHQRYSRLLDDKGRYLAVTGSDKGSNSHGQEAKYRPVVSLLMVTDEGEDGKGQGLRRFQVKNDSDMKRGALSGG